MDRTDEIPKIMNDFCNIIRFKTNKANTHNTYNNNGSITINRLQSVIKWCLLYDINFILFYFFYFFNCFSSLLFAIVN